MKKYINRNIVWAQFFVDHLVKLNVKNVVLSPGSRNTPLTYAFAKNEHIKKLKSNYFTPTEKKKKINKKKIFKTNFYTH